MILRATRAFGPVTLPPVPELSRSQILVYGAIAVALLLVGARAIRAEGGAGEGAPAAAAASFSGDLSVSAGGADVVVDVAGAVRRPGVYRMPAGSRVVDAIRRAGGAAGDAALRGINRAAHLADGQQVVVPGHDEVAARALATGEADGPISLGGATVEQLEGIEGIGPVTAAAIVEFRDEHGGLASVDQLDAVSGIGPATMESLRERLQP